MTGLVTDICLALNALELVLATLLVPTVIALSHEVFVKIPGSYAF